MKNAFVVLACICFLFVANASPFFVVTVWTSENNYYPVKSEYVSAIGVYLSDKSVKSGKSDCVSFDSKTSGKLKVSCKGFVANSVFDYAIGIVASMSIQRNKVSLPVVSRYPFFMGKNALAVKKGNLSLSLVNVWAPAYLDAVLGIPPLIEDKKIVFPVYTTGSIARTTVKLGSKSRYLARYDSLDTYCNSMPSSLKYTNLEFDGVLGTTKNHIDLKILSSTQFTCNSQYVVSRAIIISNGKKINTKIDCSTDLIASYYLINKYGGPYYSEYLFYTGNAKPICRYLGSGSFKVKDPYEVTMSYNSMQPFGEYSLALYTLYTNAADFKNKNPAIYAYYPLYGFDSPYQCNSKGISMSYGKYTFEFGGRCKYDGSYADIMGKLYEINTDGPETAAAKTAGNVVQNVPYAEMQVQYQGGYCLQQPGQFECTCSYCL